MNSLELSSTIDFSPEAHWGHCRHRSSLGRCKSQVVCYCKHCGKPYCGIHRADHEAMCPVTRDLKIGDAVTHANLGRMVYTASAAVLQRLNPDPTSIFLEDSGGETKEVSVRLIKIGAQS